MVSSFIFLLILLPERLVFLNGKAYKIILPLFSFKKTIPIQNIEGTPFKTTLAES